MTGPDEKTGWQCDLGNGEFDHDWKIVSDWEGDPGVIGGTNPICYWECRACGAQDHETEITHADLDDGEVL